MIWLLIIVLCSTEDRVCGSGFHPDPFPTARSCEEARLAAEKMVHGLTPDILDLSRCVPQGTRDAV